MAYGNNVLSGGSIQYVVSQTVQAHSMLPDDDSQYTDMGTEETPIIYPPSECPAENCIEGPDCFRPCHIKFLADPQCN